MNNIIKTKAYFENIELNIINEIKKAKQSVRICVAWINANKFLPLLADLSNKGIHIEIIYNNDLKNKLILEQYSTIDFYPIKRRRAYEYMHNKFCIIDEEIIITGSYNWSKAANFHFENIVVIYNDFELVKQYKHEFYDLIEYHKFTLHNNILRCPKCKGYTYNLGVFGNESGKYNESILSVWQVCFKNEHINFIKDEHVQYFQSFMGMNSEDIEDEDFFYSKKIMLEDFERETKEKKEIQEYFDEFSGVKIDAIGHVFIDNWNEHIEWNEDKIQVIKITWKNMFYRKYIPEKLYSDDIEKIIFKSYL